ncbi:hypothetical protein PF005_g6526 [Phytophthora fragariae]|uniref:RxLR effector protein n=1 Tax=Phytophthora fragariae TaxID=53985 RepID=A0A6A3UHP6_9STRA|nr:hypothetical protein PF003_g27909 [Phytophthora fragariae]KAE8944339.1 hypothetical protein PF009_g5980 [Phytophthora fragariae]KAE9124953.1 hypothetical protein PF010_g5806 [Phytophthora fragariae]KAE9127290.1 hypothetical protein PF007_g5653 [Phytophthora fragariae]KAE9149624.1 hypothetical protein PF006_g5895 [Phytophthora fragariae]
MITSMLAMFSFLLGFIMASSPTPDRKHGLYRQPFSYSIPRYTMHPYQKDGRDHSKHGQPNMVNQT